MKAALIIPGQATKSYNINNLPEEAWTALGGEGTSAGSVIDLYQSVPWLYRAVESLSSSIGEMPLAWESLATGDETDDPNFGFELFPSRLLNELAGDLILYGAAYVFKGTNRRRILKDVRRWHPSTVKPIFSKADGSLLGFKRTLGGMVTEYSVDEVAHCWLPARDKELGPGTAPAVAALAAAGVLKSVDDHIELYFKRGANGPVLVAFPGENPSEEELKRVQSWLDRALSSAKNAFRPLGIRTLPTLLKLSEPPTNLALPELTDKKREDVATALGVPQTVLFSSAANYATALQDDIHYYEKTVKPLAGLLEEALNVRLFEALGYRLRLHPERLEVFQRLEAEKVSALSQAYHDGALGLGEYRLQLNLSEELPDDVAPMRTPAPAPQQAAGDEQRDELRTWERFVIKRVKAGKKPARAFEAEHVPPTLKAAIEGALEAAATPDAVRHIFADAQAWAAYP